MLDMQNWLALNAEQSNDALFIIQDDKLLTSNLAGQQLLAQTSLTIDYLIEVMNSQLKRNDTETDDCFACAIKQHLSSISIPLTVPLPDETDLHYYLTYTVLDKATHISSLTLVNLGEMSRMDEVGRQQDLVSYVTRAHEEERKKISQDLHDSIAQGIFSTVMGVNRLIDFKPDDQTAALAFTQQIKLIEKQLTDVLNEVKGMALDIRPAVLDDLGLAPALKVLSNRLQESTGVTINFMSHLAQESVPEDLAIVIYRIAQEAMNNAIRHANTEEIALILVGRPHRISLEVMDQGTGFDLEHAKTHAGHSLGLLNMNERVRAFNGNFVIESKPEVGTTVRVEFPIS